MKILWSLLFTITCLLPAVLLIELDQNVLPLPSTKDTELRNLQSNIASAEILKNSTTDPGKTDTVANSELVHQTNTPSDKNLNTSQTFQELPNTQTDLNIRSSELTEEHPRSVRSPFYDPYGYPPDYYYRRRYNPYTPGVGVVLVLGGGGIGRLGGGGPRFGPGGRGPGGPGGPGFGGGRFGGGGFGGGGFGGGRIG